MPEPGEQGLIKAESAGDGLRGVRRDVRRPRRTRSPRVLPPAPTSKAWPDGCRPRGRSGLRRPQPLILPGRTAAGRRRRRWARGHPGAETAGALVLRRTPLCRTGNRSGVAGTRGATVGP
ncbi:hypothetical protein ADK64_31275 [Streptomyces sp. MMG1121]|nr:hypothetical protein ADK64_31275 [Streptomyces sp. MMG1121]